MTSLNTQPNSHQDKLAALFDMGLELDVETLQFSVVDRTLLLNGAVNSYHQKLMVEQAARSAGFDRIQNALRVVPGLTPELPFQQQNVS